ncbi:uncharacterized protein LOC111035850 isoform X2 [Myzus persicae]|nr:uncharacterized protein LOC111035850 isoform X2 [Myzus persicae]
MSLIIKTATNIWEMEKGFDIILFIDKNDVYNRDYWKDECFRRINDKYPFQKLFKTSIINVSGKSCALVYSVYGESICCLLLNWQRHQRKNETNNSKHSYSKERKKKRADSTASDVECGLRTIRDRLVGYRYLAVQRRARPVAYDFELIFRTVFRGGSGELWLCGQRRHFPSPRERVRLGLTYKRRFKVITKNNAIDRKSSNKIILPVVTTFTPKSASAIPAITNTIELLLSDNDYEKTTMQQPNIPVIKTIPENVWELDTDVDIILFIDMDLVYTDDWKDEVVEHVNDRYPFKDRLLEDIQIMPMGSGTVQIYRQNGVSIFCIFFSNRMTTLSDWMEDALIDMKRFLAGHIQLAIQQDLSLSEFQSSVYSNLFNFFQSVFTYDKVVIWFCGSGDV